MLIWGQKIFTFTVQFRKIDGNDEACSRRSFSRPRLTKLFPICKDNQAVFLKRTRQASSLLQGQTS